MLPLGIKYFIGDLIFDVNYCTRGSGWNKRKWCQRSFLLHFAFVSCEFNAKPYSR